MSTRRRIDSPTLADEIRSVRKVGLRAAILVVFLTSGLMPTVAWLWSASTNPNPIGSFQDSAAPLWDVLLRTYPLTLSVAVITLGRLRHWFHRVRIFWYAIVISAGASLGNLINSRVDMLSGDPIQAVHFFEPHRNPISGTLVMGCNYLAGFLNHYGERYFFSAVIVGVFCGWASSRLLPHAQSSVDHLQQSTVPAPHLKKQMRKRFTDLARKLVRKSTQEIET